jgi:3-deoxy-manno-octulosonate cytidylyltransferase (CMP-KDO synthetase)
MNIIGIIPARYASTRFPGKPLADINGKSMIQRVYEQAAKSKSLNRVVVATDDKRIYNHVLQFGGEVLMTSEEHTNGTSRCAEVLTKREAEEKPIDAVINIQGDEPFINPQQIDDLTALFADQNTDIATMARIIDNEEDIFDPNTVKVVIGIHDFALYFSRQTIPYVRGEKNNNWKNRHPFLKHIGLYGYRSEVLKKIVLLKPSPLESAEKLEQLRWLENGFRIKVKTTDFDSISVDTPADLEKIRRNN